MDNKNYKGVIFFIYSYCVILISALPTGAIFGFPVKIIFLIIFFLIIFFILLKKPLPTIFWNNFLCISSFLIFYFIVGLIDYKLEALKEFQLIFTTIILSVFIWILHCKVFSFRDFFNIYILSLLASLFVKILLILYGIKFGAFAMVQAFYDIFGSRIITMVLPFNLFRIYIQTDIVLAFFPFVYIWATRDGIIKPSNLLRIILIISFFAVLVSFSRYLIIINLIGLLLLLKFNRHWIIGIASLFIFIFLFLFFNFNYFYEFFELRFLSDANTESDKIRKEQFDILVNLFNKNPIIGSGIGAYDPSHIRSALNPFSYEQQILSLLPKFGILGGVVIVMTIISISYIFLNRKNWFGFFVFVLFLMSGIFNPYLFSSNVILIYSFIFIMISSKLSIRNNRFERKFPRSIHPIIIFNKSFLN